MCTQYVFKDICSIIKVLLRGTPFVCVLGGGASLTRCNDRNWEFPVENVFYECVISNPLWIL